MVGEAVFGWGKVGRTKVGRTNDDRGKDVVPMASLHAKSYFSIFSHLFPLKEPKLRQKYKLQLNGFKHRLGATSKGWSHPGESTILP